MNLPKRRLGPYELLERIGLSRTSEVHAARHTETGARVAIKRLLPHAWEDPERRARFEREVHRVMGQDQPGLVEGLGVVMGPGADGRPGDLCLVMKFVEGLQLRTLLDCLALTPPPEPAIAHVALTLAAALEALSRSEEGPLVHGDLSASNVMAHHDGTLTLLDLGSTARSGDPSLDGGTPRYAPPERQRGTPLTEAGDTYSLGVLLWELAAARRWPTEAPRHLPETSPIRGTAMGALIGQCIASDSGLRPRDGAAIRQLAATRVTAEGQEAWRQWLAATTGLSKLAPAAHSSRREGQRAWLGLGAAVGLAIWTASWFIAQMI